VSDDLRTGNRPNWLKELAPQVGLEPTTLRLTAEGLNPEYTCFQRSRDESTGGIGAFPARNWTKFWTKLYNLARFSIPDRGRTEVTLQLLDGVEPVLDTCLSPEP
jgi:hypothetical protein